uniref:DB domain-containing protein n=1 Tax=Caenorhabditis tropicalis TaxID=1561998 RepID=A0A1I7T8Y1_9PELO
MGAEKKCPPVKKGACCTAPITPGCRLPRQCYKYIMANCPDRKIAVFSRKVENDRRSAPRKPLGKCGTAEVNYQPCTSKGIANKLFLACCQLYVPEECHHMCVYETAQSVTRNMVGSRCLRMCDPSGTSIDRITKEDVTCLYNWNVIMYCHHAGIREM